MTRVLRRMGFSRQKARPSHPRRDGSAGGFKKGGFGDILASRQAPTARMKRACGCVTWWRRGEGRVKSATSGPTSSPPAPGHRRRRHPGDAERQRQGHGPVSRTLRPRSARHDVGRHDERALTVPDNVTLALLPPYSPDVERVWLYLRERFLSPAIRRMLPSDRPHRADHATLCVRSKY